MTDRAALRRRVALLLGGALAIAVSWTIPPGPPQVGVANLQPASGRDSSRTTALAPDHPAGPVVRIDPDYGRRPIYFEPNEGQADPRAKFLSRGIGYAFYLTPEESVFVLRKYAGGDGAATARGPAGRGEKPAFEISVLRMRLDGANGAPRMKGGTGTRAEQLLHRERSREVARRHPSFRQGPLRGGL